MSQPPPLPTATAPLPPASLAEVIDTFITGEKSKLPDEVRALVDPTIALPEGVAFFEKRFTLNDIVFAGCWAIGLGLFAVLAIIFGVAILFTHRRGGVAVYDKPDYWPLGFGLVCALGSWMMSLSFIERIRLRNAQLAGRPSRVGIFLLEGYLIESTDSATTVIPRAQFVRMEGPAIRYQLKGQEKSTNLPKEFVGSDRATVASLITSVMGKD